MTKCKKASTECEQCGLWMHGACIPLCDEDISHYGVCDEIYMRRCCVIADNDGADNEIIFYKHLFKLLCSYSKDMHNAYMRRGVQMVKLCILAYTLDLW